MAEKDWPAQIHCKRCNKLYLSASARVSSATAEPSKVEEPCWFCGQLNAQEEQELRDQKAMPNGPWLEPLKDHKHKYVRSYEFGFAYGQLQPQAYPDWMQDAVRGFKDNMGRVQLLGFFPLVAASMALQFGRWSSQAIFNLTGAIKRTKPFPAGFRELFEAEYAKEKLEWSSSSSCS